MWRLYTANVSVSCLGFSVIGNYVTVHSVVMLTIAVIYINAIFTCMHDYRLRW